jgi:hypothetical protein
MPTLGGSVPLYIFTDQLKTPCIGIPIANHDNNQHSANENIRLQNLWDGIETMAALLTNEVTGLQFCSSATCNVTVVPALQ